MWNSFGKSKRIHRAKVLAIMLAAAMIFFMFSKAAFADDPKNLTSFAGHIGNIIWILGEMFLWVVAVSGVVLVIHALHGYRENGERGNGQTPMAGHHAKLLGGCAILMIPLLIKVMSSGLLANTHIIFSNTPPQSGNISPSNLVLPNFDAIMPKAPPAPPPP